MLTMPERLDHILNNGATANQSTPKMIEPPIAAPFVPPMLSLKFSLKGAALRLPVAAHLVSNDPAADPALKDKVRRAKRAGQIRDMQLLYRPDPRKMMEIHHEYSLEERKAYFTGYDDHLKNRIASGVKPTIQISMKSAKEHGKQDALNGVPFLNGEMLKLFGYSEERTIEYLISYITHQTDPAGMQARRANALGYQNAYFEENKSLADIQSQNPEFSQSNIIYDYQQGRLEYINSQMQQIKNDLRNQAPIRDSLRRM